MCLSARIDIGVIERRPGETVYRVRVDDGKGAGTEHVVNVRDEDVARLAPGRAGEVLLRAAFAFLLAREPKEAIFRAFDLREIKDYFHEFEIAMARDLGSKWRG